MVLETLAPAERLAFVLHDMFAVPFDEIAPIVGRSPTPRGSSRAAPAAGCRGRARRSGLVPTPISARQREVVDAFLAAARGGDFDALLAVLDPDVVLRSDRAAAPTGASREIRGATAVARRAFGGRRQGRSAGARERRRGRRRGAAGAALVVLDFTIRDGKIVAIDAIADPARLRQLDLALLAD